MNNGNVSPHLSMKSVIAVKIEFNSQNLKQDKTFYQVKSKKAT